MDDTMADRLHGRRVVASISGGKDSAALSLWLTEQGIEHDRIHLLTGWDTQVVLEYIRGDLTRVLGPIIEIHPPKGMAVLVRDKGMFPSRARRFCTEELKVFPAQKYLNGRMAAGEDVVNAVGIRRAESAARADIAEWEWSKGFDCEVWRPLVAWTEADVIDIHQRNGLRPNPLYLRGLTRVGCWPCINATKGEIRKIAEIDPGRIDEIRALEADVGISAKARYDERRLRYQAGGVEALTTREREFCFDAGGNFKPFTRPAFFQSPMKSEGGLCWPIDRVVEWSRTKRGGRVEDRQEDLLAIGGINDGCMRWGLCETSS